MVGPRSSILLFSPWFQHELTNNDASVVKDKDLQVKQPHPKSMLQKNPSFGIALVASILRRPLFLRSTTSRRRAGRCRTRRTRAVPSSSAPGRTPRTRSRSRSVLRERDFAQGQHSENEISLKIRTPRTRFRSRSVLREQDLPQGQYSENEISLKVSTRRTRSPSRSVL